ncbi:hypothetical protein LSUE1_G000829 [Lachnellula suecica]|uniref:Rhodopsin domain-containing protein n=1 Tax=Lachnellula suecica TaxID=602035 RepID=A0A8T9CKX6_9HELO|nr:hypothetical protein LSUE1_G000829 [Lachnellula suecica]
MDPAQVYSPEYLAENNSKSLLTVVVLFAVLEVLFISLYFISRIRSPAKFGLDTYLMIPAFFTAFSMAAVSMYGIVHSADGRHVVTATSEELTVWLKLVVIVVFLYAPAVALPKLSILCLYLRIFKIQSYRYAVYAIAGVLISTCVASWITNFCMCTPFPYLWDKTIVGGHCIDQTKEFIWISFPNIVSDVAMMILPLPILWKLHTSKSQKVGLIITFLTFSIGLITAILRFVNFFKTNVFLDPTWYVIGVMVWTTAEPGCYLIAACLPSFRPLFGTLFNKIDFNSIGQRMQWYGSKVTSRGNASEKPSKSNNKGSTGSSNTPFGFERLSDPSIPRLSDGNDQKGLVACYTQPVNPDSDTERDLQENDNRIHIHKEYSLSSLPRVAKTGCGMCGRQRCTEHGR